MLKLKLLLKGIVLMTLSAAAQADQPARWSLDPSQIKLPPRTAGPLVAATAEELARVRSAWQAGPDTPAGRAVADLVARAERIVKSELVFPPEGGQHNQWYQCDACQIALKTVDATHHRCPKCGKVYSGFPYDNVPYLAAHNRNFAEVVTCGWAYAATGRAEFANRVGKTLAGYADRYERYPFIAAAVGSKDPRKLAANPYAMRSGGRIANQTLNESMLIGQAAEAYDLVADALDAAQRAHIREHLFRPMLANIRKHQAGKSNWQTWHNSGIFWAAAVLGEEKLLGEALLADGNGFVFQMQVSVSDEGMWYENSWGYHYYTLTGLIRLAEPARRLGIDLYSHPRLKKMFLLAFDYEMADGSMPRFGDMVQNGLPSSYSGGKYESVQDGWDIAAHGYAAYRDARLLTTRVGAPLSLDAVRLGRPADAAAVTPVRQSKLIPDAGHAILHAVEPGRPALSAAATFGPYGGFHGHFDKLSFVLFAGRAELGVDPGRAASQAYRLPIHQRWYKASVGHNAVLVDGHGQGPAAGRCLLFQSDPRRSTVLLACDEAFKDNGGKVRQRRLLVLDGQMLVIVDELTPADPAAEHAYWWVYHNRGRRAAAEGQPSPVKLPRHEGFEYLDDVAAVAPAGPAVVRFEMPDDKLTVDLTIATAEASPLVAQAAGSDKPGPTDTAGDASSRRPGGDVVFTATGPFRSVTERAAVALLKRSARGPVRFVAAIAPRAIDQPAEPVEVTSRRAGESVTITVKRGDRRVEITLPTGQLDAACQVR